jgi:hypothetical protein
MPVVITISDRALSAAGILAAGVVCAWADLKFYNVVEHVVCYWLFMLFWVHIWAPLLVT